MVRKPLEYSTIGSNLLRVLGLCVYKNQSQRQASLQLITTLPHTHYVIALCSALFHPLPDFPPYFHCPAYSYGRPRAVLKHTAPTGYPYSYERALAEEQAARRAAAGKRRPEHDLLGEYAQLSEDDNDDDDDGYGQHDYVYGLSPREQAYADVRRREALNRERARKIAEEQRKQAMEEMSRRERERGGQKKL